jgi:hypothetical protein
MEKDETLNAKVAINARTLRYIYLNSLI